MLLITTIILTALIGTAILHWIADVLNLRVLRTDLPSEFEGIYDAERYRRSQEYLRAHTHLGWVATLFPLSILLVFWFGGGFAWLDDWVRQTIDGAVGRGLLFIGCLALARGILDLPFQVYGTFGIEARFGFNQTTRSTFILDRAKGLLLATLIGGLVLSAVILFFESAGPRAWWYCWLFLGVFIVGMQFLAPTLILPLFNKFKPLAPGDLRDAIMTYARSIDFPLSNILVMDGSKRSGKANAFFTGFGRHKRIVLYDTLIAQHAVGELTTILAHEMGHFKQKHILQHLILALLQAGVMLYLLSLFISRPELFAAFGLNQVSVYAGLVFFSLLYTPLDFLLGLWLQQRSRRHEYAADRFAVQTTSKPDAMILALKKLSVNNLSNLRPHPFYVLLNYSHPPVLERIAAIDALRPQA
jgi:STE24 endopeptidase